MITIDITEHLAQFTATGLFVVDGESFRCDGCEISPRVHRHHDVEPELWRKLTDPCPTCHGHAYMPRKPWPEVGEEPCPNPDCAGGRQVVTLTAICTTCDGTYWTPRPVRGHASHCSVCRLNFSRCSCRRQRCTLCITTPGVVTLGRFTIPPPIPIYLSDDLPEDFRNTIEINPYGEVWLHPEIWHPLERYGLLLDPYPRPGQFGVRPDRVPDTATVLTTRVGSSTVENHTAERKPPPS